MNNGSNQFNEFPPNGNSGMVPNGNMPGMNNNPMDNMKPKKKKPSGLLIFLCVIAAFAIIGIIALAIGGGNKDGYNSGVYGDYIGKIYVEGTISENSGKGVLGDGGTYNHQWILDRIDEMIEDDDNKGIMLYVNSPGGSVTASDELYFKLEEYKEKTGRPVYAYFDNMAASGGYYISAGADKIVANRNCWTGSIGVTIGSIYDATQLLENLGIRSVPITSGPNKAMGSATAPLTDEQIGIYQSLVDEAYYQFLDIVSKGRGIDVETLKPICDGRVYTAKQALQLGLIDEIMNEEAAENYMLKTENLEDVEFADVRFIPEEPIFGPFGQAQNQRMDKILSKVEGLLSEQSTFNVTYMSPITK